VNPVTSAATKCDYVNSHRFTPSQGVGLMTKLAAVFAVAFAALALLASTTLGHIERQPAAAQISPLQMRNGQHLQQTKMTDMSLVFAQ
jgi:hypothetical protein